MEKLRDSVIKLASSDLKEPLCPSQISIIDQRLHESFPHGLHAPCHPTYATMVLKAITELNEEVGSSEDSISEYIKENYNDLPWAHKSILSHHLTKLCDDGDIELTSSNLYFVPDSTPKRATKKGKLKRRHVREKQKVSCQKMSEKLQDRRKWASEENQDSHDEIEDELVKNECRNLVVVEDKEDAKLKGQVDKQGEISEEGGELEKQDNFITKLSIPDVVKMYRRRKKNKCDQLVTGETEEDNTRNGSIIMEDSSGDEWTDNGSSLENLVKKEKDPIINPTDRDIVCALAKQFPKRALGRRVIRQFRNFKQEPKELQEALILSSQETKSNWPSWIPSLLQTDFNDQCKIHANGEKHICNLYCSDCQNGALCSSCVASHEGHHVIMIEQAGFEQLIDIAHIGMLDVTGIRTNKETSTKNYIVLKRELSSLNHVPGRSSCLFCKSRVPYPHKFCTLSCKFQHELKVG